MDKKQLEKVLVQSIESVSSTLGKNPLDLTYNEWKGMVDSNLLEKHSLLGVRFSRLKEANFKVQLNTVDTHILDIDNRARKNRNFNKFIIKDSFFFEKLEEVGQKVFANKIQPSGYSLKKNNLYLDRQLNLVLSDLHFGSDLDEREVPSKYGVLEEARSLAAVVLQTAEYKEQYRDRTILNVNLIGDIIQGHLRQDERDGANLAEQECRAMHLLSQAIAFLASKFPKVIVRCVGGNHDRDIARHIERATTQSHDNHATVIYYGIKKICQNIKNVEVQIPLRRYLTFDIFNKKCFACHGDAVFNVGNPMHNINTKNLEQQVNKINATLADNQEYSLFIVGHVHSPSLIHLANGVVVLTNGALIPPDSYSVSLGGLENVTGQWIVESVKDHIVGDSRFIRVNEEIRRDSALDRIIRPFEGY